MRSPGSAWGRQARATEPEIVHRDAHRLVVLKPAGLSTTAPDGADCLAAWVHRMEGRKTHASSRLDRGVTGLVTFALTPLAIRTLLEARRRASYHRGYIGMALGALDDRGVLTRSIAIHPRDPKLRCAVDEGARARGKKAARTAYRVMGRCGAYLALWLTPHTGRTHQLRVHAADAGAPLCGDTAYGGPRRVTLHDGRVVAFMRPMLHCAWLRLPAVGDAPPLELCAPIPEDMARSWMGVGGALDSLERRFVSQHS